MNISLQLAPRAVAGQTVLREKRILKNLARFPRSYRKQVGALAKSHRAFGDLAVSFPALLFVAAIPHKGIDGPKLRDLIVDGQGLKPLAKFAGLPMWTRRLQPEAFDRPIANLPYNEVYGRQTANHLPRRSRHAAAWLKRLSLAVQHGDEAFAVWVAREMPQQWNGEKDLCRMALWAWFSVRPELAAHQLITKPWRPKMKLKKARTAAAEWTRRVSLAVTIADAVLEPLWLPEGEFEGYEFVALNSAQAICEESDVMQNCVRSYGWDISQDQQRLWSIRKDGKRLATLSVGFGYDLNLLAITQIKAFDNAQVSRELALLANRWFRSVDTTVFAPRPGDKNDFRPSAKAWLNLLKPYILAKRRYSRWVPLAPTTGYLNQF